MRPKLWCLVGISVDSLRLMATIIPRWTAESPILKLYHLGIHVSNNHKSLIQILLTINAILNLIQYFRVNLQIIFFDIPMIICGVRLSTNMVHDWVNFKLLSRPINCLVQTSEGMIIFGNRPMIQNFLFTVPLWSLIRWLIIGYTGQRQFSLSCFQLDVDLLSDFLSFLLHYPRWLFLGLSPL